VVTKNMRTRNPSASQVGMWGTDSYISLREFCTCPGCRAVWTHMETGNLWEDEKWARGNYGRETQCMECGLITEAIPKPSFWQAMRSEYRRTVDRVPAPEDEEER